MAVLELVLSDIDFFMTSANMSDDIKLRRVDEPEFNSLPRGVYLIFVSNRPVFARRTMGKFIPLPQSEQDRLREKHIVS